MSFASAASRLIVLLFVVTPWLAADHARAEPTARSARQWRMLELEFVSSRKYDEPMSVQLTALFSGPAGATLHVPGYWDGGNSWKVRFTPTLPGEWRYTTAASDTADTGLHERQGTVAVAAAAAEDNAIFAHGGFLKVSNNRRYLTYSDGTPFFWLGDTWWFCPSSLCPIDSSSNPAYASMFKTLIDTRKRQGFTVAHLAFLGPKSPMTPSPGRWKQGDVDFWRGADAYFVYANDAGIVPIVGIGFPTQIDEASLDDLRQLWRYMIARYGSYAVTWLVVGEYNLDNVTSRVTKILELGRFIKEVDPYKRAMTIHPWHYARDQKQAWGEPWYDFIMLQGAHDAVLPPVSLYGGAFGDRPTKPVLEGEASYEGIHDMNAERVRMAAYRAIQSGAVGYTYGAQGLWYPTQNAEDTRYSEWGKPLVWWKALALPGAAQMQHLRALYESVEWWKLEPRPNGIFALEPVIEEKRILVKAKDDETFVVYFPPQLDPGFKRGLLGTDPNAHYSVTWFNPRDGHYQPGQESRDRDKRVLFLPTPPTSEDWILVLRKLP